MTKVIEAGSPGNRLLAIAQSMVLRWFDSRIEKRGDSTICIAPPSKILQKAYHFRLTRREPDFHGFGNLFPPAMAVL